MDSIIVSIILGIIIMVRIMVSIRVRIRVSVRVSIMLKILVGIFYLFSAHRKKIVWTFMVLFLIKALVSSPEGK